MAMIERTARTDITPKTKVPTNVKNIVVNAKFVSRFPDVPQGGKKKPKGKERWELEMDGLGNAEVDFEIPAQTDNMKDKEKRYEKVRALAIKAAKDQLDDAFNSHVN